MLDINSIDELDDSPVNQAKLSQISDQLSFEVAVQLVQILPKLCEAFIATLATMTEVGKSLEETKRVRWEALRDMAKGERLDKEGILEAMKIIQEIENNEKIDWDKHIENALIVSGSIAMAALIGILILRQN